MEPKIKEFLKNYLDEAEIELLDNQSEEVTHAIEKIIKAAFLFGEVLAKHIRKDNETLKESAGDIYEALEDNVYVINNEPVDAITRGKVLHGKREGKGYTQGDVADLIKGKLGLTKFDFKRISDWEKGRIKTIPNNIKNALYSILDIDEKKDLAYPKVTFVGKKRVDSVHVHYANLFADFVSEYVSTHPELSEEKNFSRNVKGDLLMLFNEFLLEQAAKEDKNK